MRRFLSALTVVLLLAACGKTENGLADDKVYFFFSNTCPHCHHALEYINAKYPNLEMAMVNVGNPEGLDLLVKAAQKFKLGNNVGTPLIVFGDKYLMGWSSEYETEFDKYVRPYAGTRQ